MLRVESAMIILSAMCIRISVRPELVEGSLSKGRQPRRSPSTSSLRQAQGERIDKLRANGDSLAETMIKALESLLFGSSMVACRSVTLILVGTHIDYHITDSRVAGQIGSGKTRDLVGSRVDTGRIPVQAEIPLLRVHE